MLLKLFVCGPEVSVTTPREQREQWWCESGVLRSCGLPLPQEQTPTPIIVAKSPACIRRATPIAGRLTLEITDNSLVMDAARVCWKKSVSSGRQSECWQCKSEVGRRHRSG